MGAHTFYAPRRGGRLLRFITIRDVGQLRPRCPGIADEVDMPLRGPCYPLVTRTTLSDTSVTGDWCRFRSGSLGSLLCGKVDLYAQDPMSAASCAERSTFTHKTPRGPGIHPGSMPDPVGAPLPHFDGVFRPHCEHLPQNFKFCSKNFLKKCRKRQHGETASPRDPC